MFIDRNGFDPKAAENVVKLKEICMGCRDCKGSCLELLQLLQVPEIVLEERGARR